MAVTWEFRTKIVNADTDLRKVWAIRTDDTKATSHSFFAKGLMKTLEDQKKIEDIIWAQWLAVKSKVVDTVAGTLKTNLEAKELI